MFVGCHAERVSGGDQEFGVELYGFFAAEGQPIDRRVLSRRQIRRRFWERLPHPVVQVALTAWGTLPAVVRRGLSPIGRIVNPRQSVRIPRLPGPETVAGVNELISAGFTPVESCTGLIAIWRAWPQDHRRSVRETRPWCLEEDTDGAVWLVRSPWQSIPLADVFNLLWAELERRDAMTRVGDELDQARDVLAMPEAAALALVRGAADK